MKRGAQKSRKSPTTRWPDLSEGEPAFRAGEEHAGRADVGALVVEETAHQDQLGDNVGGVGTVPRAFGDIGSLILPQRPHAPTVCFLIRPESKPNLTR